MASIFAGVANKAAARLRVYHPDGVGVARAKPLKMVEGIFYNVLLGEVSPLGEEAILGFNVVDWEFPLMVEVSVVVQGAQQEADAFMSLAQGMVTSYQAMMGDLRRTEGEEGLVRILPAGFGEIVFDREAQALRGVQRAVFDIQVRTSTETIGV